ncbi:hypothetical protein [Lactiplantibacillus plantarum]|uniref:hypothetical protein n=1 Tax=Lactiplantibacillus plantarum TaxID=1590 RepID=UPI001F286333|nr:hypothetical protein [Lactiplantibacillus plantarum]MCG0712769.1 putative cell surface hydrolase, membrane-bound (putative) [Lactiplantibacillus plantarum]MDN3985635.1 hypothetical protein [Lactiplantibacillus plantarum]
MRRIKIIKIMAIISATLVVGIGSYWQHRLTPLRKTRVAQTSIPTIFVGGDYARIFYRRLCAPLNRGTPDDERIGRPC